MKTSTVALASMTLAGLCATAGAGIGPNLLNNAGFESPLGFDFADPSNWNGFFGGPAGTFLQAFNDTGAAPFSGSNALVTTIRGESLGNPGFNAFTGHVQLVTGLTAGQEYELSLWARTNPMVNTGAEFRVEWQDAAGVELGRFNFVVSPLLSSQYQQFGFTDLAPANTVRANIVMAVESFNNNGVFADTSVAWDDVSFRAIPAPGAVAVIGLGLLGAARRRR